MLNCKGLSIVLLEFFYSIFKYVHVVDIWYYKRYLETKNLRLFRCWRFLWNIYLVDTGNEGGCSLHCHSNSCVNTGHVSGVDQRNNDRDTLQDRHVLQYILRENNWEIIYIEVYLLLRQVRGPGINHVGEDQEESVTHRLENVSCQEFSLRWSLNLKR